MKILSGVADCEVREANFESLRLALNFMGENLTPAYFHGIAGTVFRIGGICPCAPTCTTAMTLQQLITLLGYEYAELPYVEDSKDVDEDRSIKAVCESIDRGVPALVWNAFAPCEWGLVTGYDETEKLFHGRIPWHNGFDEYDSISWFKPKEQADLVGLLAIIIKGKSDTFNRREAEVASLKEAVRHANDIENVEKSGGADWVFLQGKAALNRWANAFSSPATERGAGDSYCIDIYSSCHSRAGEFLRLIAPNYPEAAQILLNSAILFDIEADYLRQLIPLLSWNSPWGADAERNTKAYPLLREASDNYSKAMDELDTALRYL